MSQQSNDPAPEIKRLQKENELQKGWISLISHDFKEHFGSLLWLIEAMESEQISKDDFFKMLPRIKHDIKKNLQTITDTSEWLKTQFDDFKPQLTRQFVIELFLQLKKENQERLLQKNIDFKFLGDEHLSFITDRILILFILNKIVHNAIKYSHSGSEVHLEVKKRDDFILFSVIDFGIGIDPQNVEKLFSLKSPVFKGTNGEVGAGLSLLIAKKFVLLLFGVLEILPSNPKGTTFLVKIPIIDS